MTTRDLLLARCSVNAKIMQRCDRGWKKVWITFCFGCSSMPEVPKMSNIWLHWLTQLYRHQRLFMSSRLLRQSKISCSALVIAFRAQRQSKFPSNLWPKLLRLWTRSWYRSHQMKKLALTHALRFLNVRTLFSQSYWRVGWFQTWQSITSASIFKVLLSF